MESGLERTITNAKSNELYFKQRILDINNKISTKENLDKTKIDSIETNNYSDYGRISQTLDKLIYNNNLQSANQLAKKTLKWVEENEQLNYKKREQLTEYIADTNIKLFFKTNNYTYLASAEEYCLKFTKEIGENALLTVWCKHSLLYNYALQSRYEMADKLYKENTGIGGMMMSLTALDLAKIAYMQKKYDKAESLIVNWLDRADHHSSTFQNTFFGAKYILARIYEKQAKLEQSTGLMTDILKQDNAYQNQAIWGMGKKSQQNFVKNTQLSKNNLLLNYFIDTRTPSSITAALYYSLTRKGVLLQQASQINEIAKATKDPKLNKILTDIFKIRDQLASLSLSSVSNKQTISSLNENLQTLEGKLARDIQKLKTLQNHIEPFQVNKSLGSKNILIDFHVYRKIDLSHIKSLDFWDKDVSEVDYKDEYLMALVVDGEKINLVGLGLLETHATYIRRFRNGIKTIMPTEQLHEVSNEIYKTLWDPLNKFIKNKDKIYIIPDGILHLLPFKSLQDENGDYLAQKYNLITLSSARDVVLPAPSGKATDSKIFASPLYEPDQLDQVKNFSISKNLTIADNMRSMNFSFLKGALAEGNSIKDLMDKFSYPVDLFTLENATELAIKTVQNPKILHLATHGYFINNSVESDLLTNEYSSDNTNYINNPFLRSGLAFSNANLTIKLNKNDIKEENDGILTALEVLKINLLGTDLVTLSACDTGVGDISTGDGVYSLSRAFQEAGAKSVLSSLWSIKDEGTKNFMIAFYEHYLNGESAQSSLQKTQIEFINDKRWDHPHYWGAFVMTGEEIKTVTEQ